MTMSFEQVKTYLKQRFPLIMVDRVLDIEPGKSIKALKNVTGNEIQFLGHFPGIAIMPGVLIVEAIGQCAAILLRQSVSQDQDADGVPVLGMINEMRFFAAVVPGDALILEVNILKILAGAALVEGAATVNGKVVAKGKLSLGSKIF